MGERRDVERRLCVNSIRYSVTVLEFRDRRRVDLRGEVVDISDVGVGIETDYPLEPGHVLFGHQDDLAYGVRWWDQSGSVRASSASAISLHPGPVPPCSSRFSRWRGRPGAGSCPPRLRGAAQR